MFWFREQVDDIDVAFTDRRGGCSLAPFDSLNLGQAVGDDPDLVDRNHRLLADQFGVAGFAQMHQVHGAHVRAVDAPSTGPHDPALPHCDAVVTARRDVPLLVRVADCVPVLLADSAAGVIGAVHAGRPGLVAGVVPAAVRALRDQGAQRLQAWVGPRACGTCYELPSDLADAVDRAVPGTRSTTSWGTPSVDIGRGVVAQLLDHGVEVNDVGADTCTIEDDALFSYRRQGVASGRFAGVVVRR